MPVSHDQARPPYGAEQERNNRSSKDSPPVHRGHEVAYSEEERCDPDQLYAPWQCAGNEKIDADRYLFQVVIRHSANGSPASQGPG